MDCLKFLTYVAYDLHAPLRRLVSDMERITRTMPKDHYVRELTGRILRAASDVFLAPIAAGLSIPAMACYSIIACFGSRRIEIIMPRQPSPFWNGRSVKFMSLNACFQYPWAPMTGGVVSPFDRVADCASRIEAVVNAIVEENPQVFLGQEFDDLGAQDEFIRLMKEKGYKYFGRDIGHTPRLCLENRSGTFYASQIPIEKVEFVPYPPEDRNGLAEWSSQGALTFTVRVRDQDLRFVNVHLNYHEGEENRQARYRQLTKHVMPLARKSEYAVVAGDFNDDTSKMDPKAAGFEGWRNALEGAVTCTDEGIHLLRGKRREGCRECAENIDAILHKPEKVAVEAHTKQLRLGGELLSDHFACIGVATLIA